MKVRLVCGNCGVIEEFNNWEEPYNQGWDDVYHFGYNACPNCPGVSVYFPMFHTAQAREAEREGNIDKRNELLEKAAEATMEFANPEQTKKKIEEIVNDPKAREFIEELVSKVGRKDQWS